MTFVPFRDANGNVATELANLAPSLDVILRSYVDITGRPIGNCVVATHAERNPTWDLIDEDHQIVSRNAQILSLAAIASNDYCTSTGCYANSTTFQFFRQRFTEPVDFVAIGVRRRDGSTMDAGYRHGDIKFSVPLQSKSSRDTCIDGVLAQAITSAIGAGSPASNRVIPALSFFNLANTDSDVMELPAEIILMGSAFEQLFGTFGARKLCVEFGTLFQPYGRITVNEALAGKRPGIVVDARYEAAQRQWFLHRK